MRPVPNLEMDIISTCNLHCHGCSHYSDHTLKAKVSFAEGSAWLRDWSRRIAPKTFALLGGEPSLHPQLIDYITLAAELWPDASRMVVTNGMFLDRHPGLFEVLRDTGTTLELSIHSNHDKAYLTRMGAVSQRLAEAAGRVAFQARIRRDYYLFQVTYQGYGRDMRPFADGDPRASWDICVNRACVTLAGGRLWKCPPIAFLPLVLEKYGLTGHPDWQPYLSYRGIAADCAEDELDRFLAAEHEDICGMCPAKPNWVLNMDVTHPFGATGDLPSFVACEGRKVEK